MATVAIFDVPALRPEHKNLLVGEPPQTRRFGPTCPEVVASLRSLKKTKSKEHLLCNSLDLSNNMITCVSEHR